MPMTPSEDQPDSPEHSHAVRDHTHRTQLRARFKQRRAGLTPAQRTTSSEQIARYLFELAALRNVHMVAAFAATATEVDLQPWINGHLARGGEVALPRVGAKRQMVFHLYTSSTMLEPNRFGIGEPPPSQPEVAPHAIDAILVPLVAFDSLGHRLGMGGGYYDRYLPALTPNTPIIGVAFACQQHDGALPRDVWDVPLHTVVTEQGVLEWPDT